MPVDHRSKGGVTTLTVEGYDRASEEIVDQDACGLSLRTSDGTLVAGWSYATLFSLWQHKHEQAAYVPALASQNPKRYRFGGVIRLGIKTDITYFLNAVSDGLVYYDPGLKLEHASTLPKTKVRHQFRIGSKDVGVLYENLEKQVL